MVFDGRGVGGGTSGMAAGLMHPYPGEQGRRSWKADEGIQATRRLLEVAERTLKQPVASFAGVRRLKPLIRDFEDVEQMGQEGYLIRSGATVYTSLYLQGLWQACQERGAQLTLLDVPSLDALAEYDQIAIAAGDGVVRFKECAPLKIKLIKGQVLTCAWPPDQPPLERSIVSRGYLAISGSPGICYLGATYEREFTSREPCLHTALELLKPKIGDLLPSPVILECKAGVRASSQNHLPILERLNAKTWVVAGMGSRGLLYHAYFAEMLSKNMLLA